MWATTAVSSANSMTLMRTSRTFVLALKRARLKSLPSEGYEGRFLLSKACSSNTNRPKKIPDRWSKDAALFDSAADFEWLRGAVIEQHCSLRVSVEGFDHALKFGWATDNWENLMKAVSAERDQ